LFCTITHLYVIGVRKSVETSNFKDPKITSYVYYPCEYCGNKFQLAQPDNDFSPGGAISKLRRRDPDTNEIAAIKNRAQGV
jgi:hypothetical protein